MQTDVRARIDAKTKAEAAAALEDMGLTVSDAIRMLLRRVAKEKAMPFPVRVPNAETRAAIEESRRGGLDSAESIDEMFAKLNAPD